MLSERERVGLAILALALLALITVLGQLEPPRIRVEQNCSKEVFGWGP